MISIILIFTILRNLNYCYELIDISKKFSILHLDLPGLLQNKGIISALTTQNS